MEQLKRFLRDKGFALALLACLVAAAAAGVWAVRTVRDELKENLDGLNEPDSTSTLPGIDEDLTIIPEEEYPEWQQPTTPAANSVANVPKADPAPKAGSSASSAASSGQASGSGSVREPSALQGASSPASSSAAPASTQPVFGRVLNAYSGDELVYNKTLGDWRTHNGADYAAPAGESVHPAKAGRVVAVSEDALWGNVVEIMDADSVIWRYCGLRAATVKIGDDVTTADTLGTSGSIPAEASGESHLHLECSRNGAYLDPESLL